MCNDKNECRLGVMVREWRSTFGGVDTDASEEEFLGLLIAHHFQWNGVKVLEMTASALEDANYHRECEIILGLMREAKQTFKQKK